MGIFAIYVYKSERKAYKMNHPRRETLDDMLGLQTSGN